MNVGIMRNGKTPSYLTELVAIYSKAFGINVLYMRPIDVNVNKSTVNAKTLVKGEWITVTTEIPDFIDISQFCFKVKNRAIIQYLRKKTILSDNGLNRNNKLKFIEKVRQDDKLKHLIIPTERVFNIDSIKSFINLHGKVILKPSAGQFGKDIYFLSLIEKNKYQLKFGIETIHLTEDELENFYDETLISKKYIVQKYIESNSKQGHPFDCRIHMEKNGKGEWAVARKFIRIGIGQKVVSNISQGGAVSNLTSFLNANYSDEKVKVIKKRISKISEVIPRKVESLRKQKLMTLGIDVGIDLDGSVYLFEVNGAPGTSQLRAEVAELRAQYFNYMKQQIMLEKGGV